MREIIVLPGIIFTTENTEFTEINKNIVVMPAGLEPEAKVVIMKSAGIL
jgi:hypothetical protein